MLPFPFFHAHFPFHSIHIPFFSAILKMLLRKIGDILVIQTAFCRDFHNVLRIISILLCPSSHSYSPTPIFRFDLHVIFFSDLEIALTCAEFEMSWRSNGKPFPFFHFYFFTPIFPFPFFHFYSSTSILPFLFFPSRFSILILPFHFICFSFFSAIFKVLSHKQNLRYLDDPNGIF